MKDDNIPTSSEYFLQVYSLTGSGVYKQEIEHKQRIDNVAGMELLVAYLRTAWGYSEGRAREVARKQRRSQSYPLFRNDFREMWLTVIYSFED